MYDTDIIARYEWTKNPKLSCVPYISRTYMYNIDIIARYERTKNSELSGVARLSRTNMK